MGIEVSFAIEEYLSLGFEKSGFSAFPNLSKNSTLI